MNEHLKDAGCSKHKKGKKTKPKMKKSAEQIADAIIEKMKQQKANG